MSVQFADSYVDQLFAEKNLVGLHHLISVLEKERSLPEEFWLFCRLLEWVGSTRSGVWQYYEGISDSKFEKINLALEKFGLVELAEKFRFGKSAWSKSDRAIVLDKWIDAHEQSTENLIFNLIVSRKDYLKHTS